LTVKLNRPGRPGARLNVGPDGFFSTLERGGEAAASVASVPCLKTHISTEISDCDTDAQPERPEVKYSKGRQKTAFILAESVQKLCRLKGIERVAFLTLTFPDHVLDPREAQRRLNSLLSHVVKPRYGEYTGVLERQKSGRIHYHLLVTMPFDCRFGVDFEAFLKGDYKSASRLLRNEWRFWRITSRKYGFGRTELMPIRSTEEAVGRYVGKYISKSIAASNEANTVDIDKGVRLVRYSTGARAGTSHFAFVSQKSELYRLGIKHLVDVINSQYSLNITEIDQLKYVFGPRWQYAFRFAIAEMALCISAMVQLGLDLKKIDFSELFQFKKYAGIYSLSHN
jgi:hypothetical protein